MSFIKVFTKSLNIVICALLFSSIAIALTCAKSESIKDFEMAEAVFIGKAVKTGGWNEPYAHFEVEKSWKSLDTNEITVYLKPSSVAVKPVEGETYLVYTQNFDGYSYIGICSKTKKLSDAKEDLAYLENKPTIKLAPKFLTRNMKIGLITGVIVFIFLAFGFVLMKFKS